MERQNKLYGVVNIRKVPHTLICTERDANGNGGKVIALDLKASMPNRLHDAVRVENVTSITDEEMCKIVGARYWKPQVIVDIELNSTYTAKVFKGATEIKVGCQTIPVANIREVLDIVDGKKKAVEPKMEVGTSTSLGKVPVGMYVQWKDDTNVYLKTEEGVRALSGNSDMRKGTLVKYDKNSNARVTIVAKPTNA